MLRPPQDPKRPFDDTDLESIEAIIDGWKKCLGDVANDDARPAQYLEAMAQILGYMIDEDLDLDEAAHQHIVKARVALRDAIRECQ